MSVSGFHKLHYVEWGSRRSSRVIVCAHGYSGNARDFDYLARGLADGARVIAIDVAGRGESDWFASPLQYHFGQFLADINALVSDLGVSRIEWVGTSMGGLLGMLLAAQPASPVKRLVMNDVGAFIPIDALRAIARNLQAPAHFATLGEVEAHIRHTHREWGSLTDEQWQHFTVHAARAVDGGGYRLHFDPAIARVAQPMPFQSGLLFWDAWYRVRCPVLLLRGEDSEVFPASVAATMLDANPGATLVEIPGCGHVPALMSGPQIAIVRNFLRTADDKAQWPRSRSTSSPGSSRTPMRSGTRSRTSAASPPAP